MFNKNSWKRYLIFSVLGALIYCIPVYVFIVRADYTQSVYLYIGNFLFMIAVGFFLAYASRFAEYNSSVLRLIITGQKAVLSGTVLCCISSLVLLFILVPGWLHAGARLKFLANKPANTIQDKTGGLAFMVFVNSVIGNFVAGSFITLLLPASLRGKRNSK